MHCPHRSHIETLAVSCTQATSYTCTELRRLHDLHEHELRRHDQQQLWLLFLPELLCRGRQLLLLLGTLPHASAATTPATSPCTRASSPRAEKSTVFWNIASTGSASVAASSAPTATGPCRSSGCDRRALRNHQPANHLHPLVPRGRRRVDHYADQDREHRADVSGAVIYCGPRFNRARQFVDDIRACIV